MKSLNILTIFVFLLYSTLSSTNFLPKYGSIKINSQYVIFESKDFKNDEEMYFKIETRIRNYKTQNYVEYQYIANKNGGFSSSAKTYTINFHDSIESKDSYYYTYGYADCDYYDTYYYTDYYSYYYNTYSYSYCYYAYVTKYFNIKKKSSEFEGTNGDYIIFELPVEDDYSITITNTKDDESKTITIIIIVIVVLVVVGALIAIIVCCCRRIKRNKAIAVNQAAQAAAYSQQQNMQAQAYQAQAAAYQAQAAYQGQAYPPQSYPVPIAQNNAGYSSAGGFIPA
jgi:hypothetical protein